MRSKSFVHLVLGIASLLPAAIACGSGTVGSDTGTTGSNWENRPGDFASPTQSNQDPAPYPGVGGKPAPAGGAGACPCGNSYTCTITVGKTSTSTTLTFTASSNGQCGVTGDDADDDAALSCDGNLLDKGKSVGTWSGNANQFTISSGDGRQQATFTCVRKTNATAHPVATDEPIDDPAPTRPADAG